MKADFFRMPMEYFWCTIIQIIALTHNYNKQLLFLLIKAWIFNILNEFIFNNFSL